MEKNKSKRKSQKIADTMTILVNFSLVYLTCMKNRTTRRALTVAMTSALFGNITSDYSTTGSAAINGSGGRVVQFAMKYVF